MANSDEIETTWVADFSDVNSSLAETATASEDAFGAMMDAALGAGEAIVASQEHVAETVHETGEKIREEEVNIGESLESIQKSFEQLKEVTGFAVVSEAIEKVGEAIESATERAVHFQNMADILQITTEQYQGMAAAAEEAGVNEQVLDRAGTRLVLMLQQARDGSAGAQDKLHLLGITTKEVGDESFGLAEAFAVIKERLESGETAHQERAAVLQAFSIRGALAAEAIKELATSEDALNQKSKDYNFLQQDEIDKLKELHAEYGRLKTVTENYWEKTLVYIADGIKGYSDFIDDIKSIDWDDLLKEEGPDHSAQDKAGAATAAAYAQAQKDADAVIADSHQTLTQEQLSSERESIAQFKQGSEARLAAVKKYAADVAATYTDNTKEVAQANAQVRAEDQALNDARKKFYEEASNFELSEDQKLYNEKLKLRGEYDKQRESDIAKTMADSSKDLAQVSDAQLSKQLADLKLQESAVNAAYAQKSISARQAYNQEVQLSAQELADKLRHYAQLREIYAGDEKQLDTIAKDEAKSQQQYNAQILKDQQTLAQRIKQEWAGVANAMKSSLSSAISGMIQGTQTFAQAMQSIFSSVLNAVIKMLVDWAIQWVENLIITKAATSVTAASQISANAGVAATAAMASVAAIPFYGWAMAPEVGAETAGVALGYESLAFAAGGFEVPSDQLAFLHKDEKVLPARFSTGLTNLVNAHADGSGPQQSGQSQPAFVLKVQQADPDNYLVKAADLPQLLQSLNNRFMFSGIRR